MKRLVSVCLLMMLCLFALPALSEAAQPCYWQLTDVSVAQVCDDKLGDAEVLTSAVPLPDLRPIDMISALSQGHTFSLDVMRAATGSSAHADYVLSGVPALIPGAGSARLSLTGATANSTSSLYLYASVYANKARALRVRSTGAWVFRIAFPRTAVAGTTRTLRFDAKELQGYASVSVVYTYTAMPGKMLVDGNGDTVLYDALGNEIDRIPRALADVLPVFAASSGADGHALLRRGAARRRPAGALSARRRADA